MDIIGKSEVFYAHHSIILLQLRETILYFLESN